MLAMEPRPPLTMNYEIDLEIAARYPHSADHARYLLRLQPQQLAGLQHVESARLTVEPEPDEHQEFVDFFGNPVVEIAYAEAQAHVQFRLQARVQHQVLALPQDRSASLSSLPAELAAIRSLQGDSPLHFLGASERVGLDADFHDYAKAQCKASASTRVIGETIGLALHRDMRFDPDATTVDTPALEALHARHGVCQDFSHIMIACLRTLGIPAGYVSGFLRTDPPPGKPRLEGADAMHAWVQFWCGTEMGWVEYDPTNAMFAGADHVLIARGRDYSDVSPIKGALRSSGEQASEQRVTVKPL